MAGTPLPILNTRRNWIRMRTFTSLRWLAVAGQLVAVVFASEFLGIGLRLDLCLLAIAASLAFNLITAMNTRPPLRSWCWRR